MAEQVVDLAGDLTTMIGIILVPVFLIGLIAVPFLLADRTQVGWLHRGP
jgi:hypothetical protein